MGPNIKNVFDSIREFITPRNSFSYNFRQPAQSPIPSPSPVPTSSPMPSAMPQPSFSIESIKQGIASHWGADNPLIQQAQLLYQAGRQLPASIDPYIPTILALRETQGGRDLSDPVKAQRLGKNNIYNIRGTQNGRFGFVNYPDVKTAILGGPNGQYQSQGLLGTLLNNPSYQAFRKSGNIGDLLKVWSPPVDNNGSVDEQIQNYNWIRSKFGPQLITQTR